MVSGDQTAESLLIRFMTTNPISNSNGYDEPTNSSSRVTTDETRNRLKDILFSALESAENACIEAPTSTGKTHLVATTRWRDYPEITGGQPIIHVHQTKEARNDAIQKSRDEPGVEYRDLRGRTDTCPVAAGDYDDKITAPNGLAPSEWFDWMCNVRNITFQDAHQQLMQECHIPCGTHCDAATQWWGITDTDDELDYDVIHTTANFAHVDDLIEGANVIFDERPEYGLTFNDREQMQFQRATTNLLEYRSDDKYAIFDLKYAVVRNKLRLKTELAEFFEDEVTEEWLFRREETHRLAPAIGRAILNSEEVCGGRYHGKDGRVEIIMDGRNGEIRHVQHTPELSRSRCIIGLDAFPSETRWRINTVDDLESREVLSPTERKVWRRNERGLIIKQVGDATRAYTQGWKGAGEKRCRAIIQKIRELHGEAFQSCIAPSSIEQDVRQMMSEVGVDEPKTMHYGEQKSRNDFSDERVSLLIACIDPGDEKLLDLLALCDAVAEPEITLTEEGKKKRKPGRGFVGPDADIAVDLLASVRENNLAQAAGRYARNPDDSRSGATVYVWSDALPESMVDEKIETSYQSTTKKQDRFVKVLKQNPSGCTAKTISEEVGSDKSYIINWLSKMEQHNKVTKSVGTGYQGATEWRWCDGNFRPFVVFNS